MNNRIVKTIVLLGILLLGTEYATAKSIAKNIIKPEKSEALKIPMEMYDLSVGPAGDTETLRVALQTVEFYYCDIYVEVIKFGETEGDPSIVKHTYLLNSFTLGKKLGVKLIAGLKFIKWHGWNRFELQAEEANFMLTYNPKSGTFDVKKLKSKR